MSLRKNYHKIISKLCNKFNNEYKNNVIAKRISQKIVILDQINKILSTNLNKDKYNKTSF